MNATLRPIEVNCPECGDPISVPLTLATLPKINPSDPLTVEVMPDHRPIQQHIRQAHTADL